ncbi:uncharacterized protein [Hoplias malabaricus]|uniref:uncharacterized protein isoform X2 n=1 Tax=Hoplias malabaricus TaxID=27720 RepID=UPI0034618E82
MSSFHAKRALLECHYYIYRITAGMYLVVSFPEENNLSAIVPDTWYHEGQCYWPPYNTLERVKKAAVNSESPDPESWTVHPASVLKAKDNYEKAHEYYLRVKKGESIDTEPEDVFTKRKRKSTLKCTASTLLNVDSEDEDSYLPPAPKAPRPKQFTKKELINSFKDLYSSRLLRKALCLAGDPTHTLHSFFGLLQSGWRLRSLRARTSTLRESSIHQAASNIESAVCMLLNYINK